MLQNLKIFKSSSPIAAHTAVDSVAVSSDMSDDGVEQSGTSENIKSVKGPTREELEADFAFITDVLSKAGPEVTPMPRRQSVTRVINQTTRVIDPGKTRVLEPKAPSFVPQHRRTKAINGDQPVFAVQSEPRSAKPDFLRESAAEEQLQEELTPSRTLDVQVFAAEEEWVEEPAAELSSAPEVSAAGVADAPVPEDTPEAVELAPAAAPPPARRRRNGTRVLESVPIEEVTRTITTILNTTEEEAAAPVVEDVKTDRSSKIVTILSKAIPSMSPVNYSDPYDFGPEIPRALRMVLNGLFRQPRCDEEFMAA